MPGKPKYRYAAGLWHVVQVSLVRPLWSTGILVASPSPVSWHIRQSARPSSVCGIAVGVAAGGVGTGSSFVGGGGSVGSSAGAAHAATSGTIISSVAINNHSTGLHLTIVTSQFIIGYIHSQ